MNFIIIFLLLIILNKTIKIRSDIMAAIDDLNSSVSSLQSTVDLVVIKIDELKNQPSNDAAIAAASSTINEAVTKLNNAIQ